jgi:glycosyltransferase involved in cell wall biosynthesis
VIKDTAGIRKLKIAIIGSKGFPVVYGGYETFVSELALRLVARGHEVTIYCHRSLFIVRPSMFEDIKLVYIPGIESKNLGQLTHSFLSTLHVIFTSNDIVFYVNSANGPFGIITRLFKKRTVINVDGLEWLRPKWKGFGAKYFYIASMLATKLFDVVVTDSERMAEIYKTEFKAKSVVITYGANLSGSTQPVLIQKYGLVPEEYYLIVGRLVPDNNASLIVQEFLQSETQKKLVVVGDVPYKDRYAESIKRIGNPRIIFTGYVKDADLLSELYANAYAYIHGHGYGGTNPTLLMALASGCCILALDNVFNREVLDGDDYGLYFNKDPQNLSRLIDFIDHHTAALEVYRAKSRDRITENYTWEKITEQYENLFESLMGK